MAVPGFHARESTAGKRRRQEQDGEDGDDEKRGVEPWKQRRLPGGAGVSRRRLLVVLEGASLESVKVGKTYELLNCDKHKSLLIKNGRDPGQVRPDITHQSLLMLMDSPLNRAGLLQVYIHTQRNVLIEVNPQTRIPRTFDRFCGLMGESLFPDRPSCSLLCTTMWFRGTLESHCQNSADVQSLLICLLLHSMVLEYSMDVAIAVQLLHKLSVRAADGPQKLLKVIKNPVSDHFPVGCLKIGTSFSSQQVVHIRDLVPEMEPVVFVVGAFAHGVVNVDYTEKTVSISNYPLSAALTCAKLCTAFEEVWKVV